MSSVDRNRGTTFVLLVIGAVATWLAVLFVGPFFDNYEVKQAIALALNHARQISDDAIRRQIMGESLGTVGTHWEESSDGSLREVPGLGLKEENIVIQRDPNGRVLIRIDYERRIRLKPFNLFATWRVSEEKEAVPLLTLKNPAGG